MTYRAIFEPKVQDVNTTVVFDFSNFIPFGEGVEVADITAVVHSGVDAAPEDLIADEDYDTTLPTVTVFLTGGVKGVTYKLSCVIDDTAGSTFSMMGYLTVTAPTDEA